MWGKHTKPLERTGESRHGQKKGGCVGQKELLLDRTVGGFKNQRERVKIGQRQSPGCCWHYTCRNRGLMTLSRLWGGVSAQGGFSVPLLDVTGVTPLGDRSRAGGATPHHSHGGGHPAPSMDVLHGEMEEGRSKNQP